MTSRPLAIGLCLVVLGLVALLLAVAPPAPGANLQPCLCRRGAVWPWCPRHGWIARPA